MFKFPSTSVPTVGDNLLYFEMSPIGVFKSLGYMALFPQNGAELVMCTVRFPSQDRGHVITL